MSEKLTLKVIDKMNSMLRMLVHKIVLDVIDIFYFQPLLPYLICAPSGITAYLFSLSLIKQNVLSIQIVFKFELENSNKY